MDKNLTIELWRSLSPRLSRFIPCQGPSKDKDAGEEKPYGEREEETARSVENHQEEDDV